MTQSHKPEEYMRNRYRRGTPEHMWHKWFNKLWKAYPMHYDSKRGEPPSFMRDEFIRDIKYLIKFESENKLELVDKKLES